ncbi:hypothetical protein SLS60_006568 [Paraconiothyrium brasiliense]|uniref:Uncharacterized protein n=1 Tax=Paraconiothyrium brasiliense TaxID=300254 RepID=A0ABR3RBH9_9PLEO
MAQSMEDLIVEFFDKLLDEDGLNAPQTFVELHPGKAKFLFDLIIDYGLRKLIEAGDSPSKELYAEETFTKMYGIHLDEIEQLCAAVLEFVLDPIPGFLESQTALKPITSLPALKPTVPLPALEVPVIRTRGYFDSKASDKAYRKLYPDSTKLARDNSRYGEQSITFSLVELDALLWMDTFTDSRGRKLCNFLKDFLPANDGT